MPRGRPRKPTTRADNGVDEDHQIQRHVEHRCEICSQSFSSEAQIQKHLRDHKLNDKLYRCDQCPVSFNVEFNLELHKSTHTSSQPDCPVCHKKFSRVASLKAHISLHQKEENFLCAECGDEFVLQSQLSFHLEEHRQELSGKTFTCRTCSQEFLSPGQLKEHARSHGKHRPIARNARTHTSIDRRGFKNICHHCGKTFKKPSQLVRHVRIHTGERPYKCSYCDKSFNQKVVLQTHMVRHTGEKPHMCLLCPASFSQKGNLHSHVQRVHAQPSGAQVFPCMDCSCVYKKLGSLNAHISKMHISVMEVEEPATQKADGKVFQGVAGSEGSEGPEVVTDVIQQLLELSDHVTADPAQATPPAPAIDAINQDILQQALENSGLSEIPVQPDAHRQKTDGALASKVLVTDTALKREKRSIVKKPPQILGNLRQDNGVRWHGCQYCSKEFKKPSDLVRHIRIHTHEKPYKCKQCFRAFAVKSTLTAHMKIHSGIKAFVCHFCMKCFSTSGSMKVHQRLHTGVRPFPCPHCDKFFRTSGHRKTHIACHFKSLHQKKNKHPRKLHKSRASRSNISLADIPLQEPILITDIGLLQNQTTRAALQQYLDIVECQSERQYKCGFCNKSYKKSSHLKQHVRSHTGERPYKCLQCSKGFASSGVLKAHIRTHSGLKAFKCLMCDTSFTTSGSLRRHMTTHSDMRPYMCPYCQKTFKSSPNCRKHMKTHRYELAQQQQQQGLSDLQPSTSEVDPKTQSILEVVSDGQQDGLPAPLGEDALQETESFVSAQHVLPPHLNQFETPTIAQPTYEQPALTQAFSLADGFSQQSFSTVQQLQDSSTLESQSLTSSFHTPNILHVTDSEASGLLQETSPDELQLSMQTQDFHDEEENDKRVYPCNLCEKSFKKSSHLKQHVRSHTGEKPYRCNICGKSFVAAGVLKSHLNTHTGVKAFRCNVCHTSFTTNGSLNRHLTIHQDSKLKCGVCQETFRTLLMRRRHMRHHHAAAPRAFDEADETGEEAERPAAKRNRGSIIVLTEEQTAELAKRPPQDQSSVSERVLVQTAAERDRVSQVKEKCHALALEPKYGNSCQYCPKSFKKPSDLVRHIRTHTGEKPYKCDECEKTFTVKSTLDCHVKTHLGQKLFTCHMCHTSFSTKGSLKVHMRLHTGSKPFKCSMCDLSFRTSGHRKTHIQGHSRPSERKGQRAAKAEQDVQSFHASADPSIFISASPVLGHCDAALVGQAILPATMSANGDLTVSLSDSLTTLDGIQLVCPNLQISGIDTSSINNITLQFDPNVLQQTLQQSSLLSHSLTSDPMTPADPPGAANVVLHPLAGLALPPSIPVSVAVANLTGEQENAAVDCGGGAPEITLTINNSSLSEALVQNSATTSAAASGSPEITLTIAGSGVGELLAPCSSSSNMEAVGAQEASATPSSQNMVMSSASLASDGSVTLTIADPLSAAPHSLEAEKHQCYYCSHVLLTANALRRHCRLVHGKERCHVCRLCNKGFKRATHLKEHEYVHKKGPKVNPQKPKVFKCPNCDKAFAKPSQLERHNRTHTGERPFRCPVCERAFNQKSALQVHRVKHTGEKPYRCEVCTISFTQKCNMKLHMKRSHGLATANHTHTAASVTRDVDLGNDSESGEMDTPTDWPCPITFPPPSAM